MEQGTIELFSKTNFTSSSTATEDFLPYLKATAQKLCNVTGMIILEDKTKVISDKYVLVYVGYEGDTHPMYAFFNNRYSNYYYFNFGICLTYDSDTAEEIVSTNSPYNSNYYYISTNNYAYYINYIKTSNIFAFGIYQTVPAYPNLFDFLIVKLTYTDEDEKKEIPVAMHKYNSAFYASDDERLALLNFPKIFEHIINIFGTYSGMLPRMKEMLVDQPIYPYIIGQADCRFEQLRWYSNTTQIQAGMTIKILGIRYFILSMASKYPSLLLKLDEGLEMT